MQTLHWHPKFLRFEIERSGILLLGETLSYYFSHASHPGLELISSGQSPELTLMQRGQIQLLPYFKHYSQRLMELGIIINGQSAASLGGQYCRDLQPNPVSLVKQSHLHIINVSTAQPTYLDNWLTLLQSEQIAKALQQYDAPVTIILTDGHDHPTIDEAIENSQYWMLLKITGERFWIGPLVNNGAEPKVDWPLIKKRINNNKPEQQLISRLYPHETLQLPYRQLATLEPQLQQQLQSLLLKQLSGDQLCVLAHQDGEVSDHPFKQIRSHNDSSLARQIEQPVELRRRVVQFDEDGGSRCESPETTLAKLQPLISPITGIINQFYELAADKDHPLKIYASRFAKVPTRRQLPKLSLADFSLACAGKGVSSTQSKVSALCEALERYAPVYQGNEPLFASRQSDLAGPSYNPSQLTPYSEQQYQAFKQPQHLFYQTKHAKERYQDQSIHWLPAWSLTKQQPVHVPLANVFSNTPFDDERYCFWHSNGCATGNNLEEAILQAMFELIERDATGIWWYNQIPRPGYDLSQLPQSVLDKVSQTLPDSLDFWILDITNNNRVPVMVAVAQDRQTRGFTLGLGCHLNPQLAAQRALTELCQLYPNRNDHKSWFDFDKIADEPFLHPDPQARPCGDPLTPNEDISQNISVMVEQLARQDLETLVVDYSRNDLPVKTVKVFIPGLCHMWPEFGNPRLYKYPVAMGWQVAPSTEQTLNPQFLLI